MTSTPRPEVVVFDVNETLTDMSPVRARLVSVGAPGSLFDAWFASVLRDGFALTAAGGYADFGEIARSRVSDLLAGLPSPPADVERAADQVLSVLPDLDLHADVADGLRALHGAGLRLVTLTNGASAMSDGALDRAGVRGLFDQRLSVSEPRVWKPGAAAYAHAVAATGVPADRLALVAVHPWDVDGAARAGLTGAWLNRSGGEYPPYFTPPAVIGETLPDLAAALIG